MRRAETWGETYRRLVTAGWDHGAAAWQADQNELAQKRRARRAILDNVRPEIREEVAYALDLASASEEG